eukprot:TRINITY_DN7724_c0_g1_i1.p1 TRINITY_DN7724_c0_g1~~TRINITY_DN7724_c0_g1_i1.p1  ORF type:complete len:366 (-),score=67.34 TRINITY_DN7724_c0_g1_i1:36-983(-)
MLPSDPSELRQILPELISGLWDDPDALHSFIDAMINQNTTNFLQPSNCITSSDVIIDESLSIGDLVQIAANRLIEIDPNVERAYVCSAIVKTNCGFIHQGEQILRQFTTENASNISSPYAYANLAMIAMKLGDKTKSRNALFQALRFRPNSIQLLEEWHNIIQEQCGKNLVEYEHQLRSILGFSDSWKVCAFLGEFLLNQNRKQESLMMYHNLMRSGGESCMWSMLRMTNVLMKNRNFELVINLASASYIPDVHGLNTGLNILTCYLALGRSAKAIELMEEIKLWSGRLIDPKKTLVQEALQKFETSVSQASTPN